MATKTQNNKALVNKIASRQAEKIAGMTNLKEQEKAFAQYRKILQAQKKYK
jgi:hypothetical protein